MTATYQSVKLAQWFDEPEFPNDGMSTLFGELVKLAIPVVKHYLGDLYHDADWLKSHVKNQARSGFTFYYAMNEMGTAIGTKKDYVYPWRTEAQYRIVLTQTRGVWAAEITDETGKD